jgi:hypothetical protein
MCRICTEKAKNTVRARANVSAAPAVGQRKPDCQRPRSQRAHPPARDDHRGRSASASTRALETEHDRARIIVTVITAFALPASELPYLRPRQEALRATHTVKRQKHLLIDPKQILLLCSTQKLRDAVMSTKPFESLNRGDPGAANDLLRALSVSFDRGPSHAANASDRRLLDRR